MAKKKRPENYEAYGAADAHAHVERAVFSDGVDQLLERAWKHGLSAIIAVAADKVPTIFEETRALAHRHERVWATAGIHPHYAQHHEILWDAMIAILDDPKVVAIGEFGLDYHYMNSPREIQREIMTRQLQQALERQMPMVLHVREAFEESLEILDSFAPEHHGIVHCFSGNQAEAQAYLDRGFYLSIPGIVTFPKALDLHQAVRSCPVDRLLVETDCPYLAPAPCRGRRNEPAYLAFTVEAVAKLKEMPVEQLARATWQNTRKVYGI